jgi:hypothetical protein
METKRSFRDSILRAVALIGLILVLMLGAWGIILLAFNLPTIASNVGGSIVSLFAGSPATTTVQVATTTTPVVVTTPTQTNNNPVVINPKPTTQPTTTYVPATTHTPTLYGNADLAVRIISATPTNAAYGQSYGAVSRVNVKFEVENIGTNVAPAGWMFTANLPVGYSYIYSSPTQKALNPGDKIVYTLGFNTTYQNQYCTQQYPNQNCPWYSQPYQPYPYQGICYQYDGYQNIPVSCPNNTNPNYDYYNQNNNYNNTNYNYNGAMINITVDPRNWIYDTNRYNNTASIASPLSY